MIYATQQPASDGSFIVGPDGPTCTLLAFETREDFKLYQHDVFELGNPRTDNVIEHSYAPRFKKWWSGRKMKRMHVTSERTIHFWELHILGQDLGESLGDPPLYKLYDFNNVEMEELYS